MVILVGLTSITVLAQASQVYQSEELNFSLSYPEGWNVQALPEGGVRGIALTPSDNDWVIVYLMTLNLERDNIPLEEASNSILGDLTQSYPYLSLVQEPAYITVGDGQGVSAFYKGVDTASGMQEAEIVWAVVLVQKNLGYLFLADAIESQFDEYQADFNEIIRSFKFSPKVATAFAPTFRSKEQSFVLVAGDPPLTQKVVNTYMNIVEFALKFQMTEVQKELVTKALIKEYKEGTPEERKDLINIEPTWDQIASASKEEREGLRIVFAQYLLGEAQKDPNDPLSAMIIDVYNKTNMILVQDTPPFTQQSLEAFVEMLQFTISVITGQEHRSSQEEINEIAKSIITAYPTYPPEVKQFFSQSDLAWTIIRYAWSQADEAQRAQIIDQLAQLFFGTTKDNLMVDASAKVSERMPTATGEVGQAELLAKQQELMDKQLNFQMQMNILNMQHEMSMSIINNMPGGGGMVYGYEDSYGTFWEY